MRWMDTHTWLHVYLYFTLDWWSPAVITFHNIIEIKLVFIIKVKRYFVVALEYYFKRHHDNRPVPGRWGDVEGRFGKCGWTALFMKRSTIYQCTKNRNTLTETNKTVTVLVWRNYEAVNRDYYILYISI